MTPTTPPRRMSATVLLAGLLPMLAAFAADCDNLLDDVDPRNCQTAIAPAAIGGNWEVIAYVDRTGCTVERRDGPMQIRNDRPWVVTQSPLAGSAAEATFSIRVPDVLPAAFRVNAARVRGTCVDFETLETVALPENSASSIQLVWRGEVTATNVIQGTVTGTGPDTCRLEGTFTIEVVP